jgi:hypothetical protein
MIIRGAGRSIEKLTEEAFTVMPLVLLVVTVMTVSAVSAVWLRVGLLIGLRRRITAGSRLLMLAALLPGLLGVDQPLELAAVQEDAAALETLVHRDAAALELAHLATALGACHHPSTVTVTRHVMVDRPA